MKRLVLNTPSRVTGCSTTGLLWWLRNDFSRWLPLDFSISRKGSKRPSWRLILCGGITLLETTLLASTWETSAVRTKDLLRNRLTSDIAQELYMIISLSELPLERGYLRLQFIDQFHLRVLILRRLIRNEASFGRIGKRRKILFDVGIRGREARDHQTIWVPTNALLQKTGQLRVAIRNMLQGGHLLSTLGTVS